jgi:metal-responsive CopG/Arc/MetJ family transcriptional regulator
MSERKSKAGRPPKENKVRISLPLEQTTLNQLDAMAKEKGFSRVALITSAIAQVLEKGLHLDWTKPEGTK